MLCRNIIEIFLIKFLKKKRILISKINFEKNYLKEMIIDSLQFIEMITEIEKKFKFKFKKKQYELNSFYTINGLIELIIKNAK